VNEVFHAGLKRHGAAVPLQTRMKKPVALARTTLTKQRASQRIYVSVFFDLRSKTKKTLT
jgi:hypothetical protein